MGKLDFTIDGDFARKLERLADFDAIAEEALTEAVPILETHVKIETAKHKDTGDMLASIRTQKKPKKSKSGNWYTAVLPTGEDANGVRNMEKMALLEYGTSKIPARPILSKALNDAREKIYAKIQEVVDKWVEK